MRLPALKLRRGDRDVLESWTRAGTIEARLAKRAKIVLAAADGMSNRDIGEMVEMHYNQVAVWRHRYAELGLAGLADEERSGRPPTGCRSRPRSAGVSAGLWTSSPGRSSRG